MLNLIAGGVLAAALAAAPQTDTTFAVQPGARLDLNNMGGEIVIRAWDRSAVRVEAEHSSRTRVEVQNTGSVVRVRARSQFGPANIVDYRITVPASMALDLSGMYSDIQVEGTRAEVKAQTVQGEITIRGGQNVSARSVQGQVTVRGARGNVRVHSTSEDVHVAESSGEIMVETVSGDAVLERIDSRRVEAGTVSGDVFYDGSLQNGGRYSFVSHSGDVTAVVPAGANATVSVATMSGDLDASFSLPSIDEERRRRYSFTLGSGSAELEMETFSGDIRLRRPGEVRPRLREDPDERRPPRAPRPPREPGVSAEPREVPRPPRNPDAR
ncbi:MAG TPA: DUF4097 family beta strand repeat-containing protein [Longimicrobiaceae bacterium]|nr:DUF4097 family beta strand repeat-containing protein [Longimicrobiaceae bacterium]